MSESVIITIITAVLTGIGAVAGWAGRFIVNALQECKQEHSKAINKIEELHDELKDVSRAVGMLEGQLTAYHNQNRQNAVDTSEE